MSRVQIFWDPSGFELDSLGDKQYLATSDGDTPTVSVSIRMLSIDTPELHYPGNQKPSRYDGTLLEMANWIQAGKAPISDGLAAYLYPRLATGTAGSLHEQQALAAKAYFQDLLAQRLTRPNGTTRRVFLRAADQPFDQYGRLLAYMSPEYTAKEREGMSRRDRATFNLLMVESGWAAPFIIYPSLPSYYDLVIFQEAARAAFEERRGAYAHQLMLTGYEYRMCIRLHGLVKKLESADRVTASDRTWIERYCADMTTREIFYPEDYHRVPPYNRIFILPKDVNEAVGKMSLTPGI
jgi:endonuclease YncB( thermonuclease family)